MKGKGIPTLRNKSVRGDHYVTLVVQVPENLTDEQKSILNQYENASGPAVNTRSSTDSAGDFSFGGHKRKKFRK